MGWRGEGGEEGAEEFFQISGRASVWVVALLTEMGIQAKSGFCYCRSDFQGWNCRY